MGLISYKTASSIKLRAKNLWTLKFDYSPLNILGEYSAAEDVNFQGATPLIKEMTVGPEIPVVIWYGYNPPQEITVTFNENDSAVIYRELEKFIRGRLSGINFLGRSAIPLNQLEKVSLNVEVTQYNQEGDSISSNIFKVIPKDPLTLVLDNSDTAQTHQISFKIIGEISSENQ